MARVLFFISLINIPNSASSICSAGMGLAPTIGQKTLWMRTGKKQRKKYTDHSNKQPVSCDHCHTANNLLNFMDILYSDL